MSPLDRDRHEAELHGKVTRLERTVLRSDRNAIFSENLVERFFRFLADQLARRTIDDVDGRGFFRLGGGHVFAPKTCENDDVGANALV
jgi:hypothetical protein